MTPRAFLVAALLCSTISAHAATVQVIEYYNSSQDHYFITSVPAEIQALDSGTQVGWKRTGRSFEAYPAATGNASPVCRFYIPPAQGDSHFYSASPTECQQTAAKYPAFVEESTAVMYVDLPDPTSGACPAGDIPLYRVFDNRTDTNHRYMIDANLRAQMIAQGWVAEGYGPDQVIMCVPSTTPPSSIAPSCVGTNANVPVPGAPHGMYVWNPNHLPAFQQALANDVIGKDPTLCGASIVINWADVAPANGVYNWDAVYAAAKPYTDAALTVNLLFAEITETAQGQVTPHWVTDSVASGGLGVPTVTCPGLPPIPVAFNPAYEAAWSAFIAAAIQEFSFKNSTLARSVGYMRFATGMGAEAIPPTNVNVEPCKSMWTAAGFSYDTWNAHAVRIINATAAQPTDKQIIVSLANVPGGPAGSNVYAASDLAAAAAVAKHIGLSFESLGKSNVAAPHTTPALCDVKADATNSDFHWCQAYQTYAKQVPLAAQTITATFQANPAVIDIGNVLQYAIKNNIQILELYPYEWTQANSPGSPNFDPAKQAEYQQSLKAAAQVLGATNGR